MRSFALAAGLTSSWVTELKNPKSEARNTKQIQNTKYQCSKRMPVWSGFEFYPLGFGFVSYFALRISDFALHPAIKPTFFRATRALFLRNRHSNHEALSIH